jgi:hypothetical protein
VRGEVVEHEVDVELARDASLDRVEELSELDCSMTSATLADHLAGLHVEGSEQRCRAVTHVVVRASLGLAWSEREEWTRPVERLYLRLLVYAENQSPFRRREIQSDDVPDLLDEQRVGRELERLRAVRLKAERPPDPADGALRHPQAARH